METLWDTSAHDWHETIRGFLFVCPSSPTQVTTEHRPDMLMEKLRINAGSQCSFLYISPTDTTDITAS